MSSGHALVEALDKEHISPRLAMWVHNEDTGTWKLWIVPRASLKDKADFYRRVSGIVSRNRNTFGSIDASDTEFVPDTHPAVKGLKNFIRVEKLGSVFFSGNTFNNYYLPDGIILRSVL